MQRDSFVRYKSCSEALKLLPDENRLHAFDFITNYWIYGIEPDSTIDPVAYGYFLLVKPNIDANNEFAPDAAEPIDDVSNLMIFLQSANA